MPWWGWILLAAVLLGSELFVTTEFYLVFLGFSALVVGLSDLLLFDSAVWVEWLSFGVLSAVFLVFFRRRLWGAVSEPETPVRDRVVGEIATASERIEPGATGRAELRGAVWTVKNVGDEPLESGARARAEQVEGVLLHVRAES